MSKLLDFVVRCNNATEYDAIDDIIRMANPDSFDSQDEMTDHFEDCLGYDPFEYFDRKFVETQFDEIINTAPYSVQEKLREKKFDIIDRTMNSLDDVNENVIQKIFFTVIEDEVGWTPVSEMASLDDCISMSVFGDNFEYESDDEESEDEEDYSEDDEDESYSMYYDDPDNDDE